MSTLTKAYARTEAGVAGSRVAGAARAACIGVAMLVGSGCTTMQPIDRATAASTVEPGQTVLVTTHDGRELELFLDDWTSEALTGTDELGLAQKIENDDIARVEVERVSIARSVGLGVAIVGVAAGIAAAAGDGDGIDY
jgi:hypothetical protein